MTVTRDFKELVQKRIARDPAFGDALLREGIDTMLAGDVDTGKSNTPQSLGLARPGFHREVSHGLLPRRDLLRRPIRNGAQVFRHRDGRLCEVFFLLVKGRVCGLRIEARRKQRQIPEALNQCGNLRRGDMRPSVGRVSR